jgi:hypothetical protein
MAAVSMDLSEVSTTTTHIEFLLYKNVNNINRPYVQVYIIFFLRKSIILFG